MDTLHRLAIALAAMVFATASTPPRPADHPTDLDCGDFATQREAQAHLDKDVRLYKRDVCDLDRGNGRACEHLP